ncbi:hypothetical protein DFQ01_101317 [Paenibacillus cellulosilyticus]|uniref:Tetratricopeptide repeat protein n=1 Tax=Paenibacillus cellulosilyticus TaxID=375489 RepID=A0A2V2Z0K3_9BACL|nr:hypothetical protein [Paenibacillus cellulosilyticus]PWW08594.1 hypothetical protein DFQ01_101317 [Paenibacillus cellulosilyticus]QKS48163.1 hypothetical protein HUB94_28205 [Paenibacillus cellulosilyticus]
MRFIKRLALAIVLGVIIGVWLGMSGTEFNTSTLIIIVACAVIVIYGALLMQMNYVLRYSRNNQAVDKCIRKLSRTVPYYAAVCDLIDGKPESAAARMGNIKSDKLRAVMGANLAIASERWQEAEQHINRQDNNDVKYVSRALTRLLQDDQSGFEQSMRMVDHPGLKYALEAEAAFRQGDLTKADELGDLAINNTAGLQRYALIRYRELRTAEPNRKTYF